MKKGIVIGCNDFPMDALLSQIASVLGVQDVHQFRVAGPDAVLRLEEFLEERSGLLAGIRRLIVREPIEAFAVVAHEGCLDFCASTEVHRTSVQEAAQTFKAVLPTTQPVHALLAVREKRDSGWRFEQNGKC